MKLNLSKELAAMEQMTVGELQDRYANVFGEAARSRHRQYLIRRIAWRVQANAEGGLSERALRRAEELANDADVRVTPPRVAASANVGPIVGGKSVRVAVATVTAAQRQAATDPRLPSIGSQITRKYKGRTLHVTILVNGFEYLGERYRSLSAVAKAITGSHMNGFRFFGLEGRP